MNRIRRRWKLYLPLGAVAAVALGWLAFGFFGVQTLFIDDVADDAPPVFASGAGASGLPSDAISEEQAEAMTEAMRQEGRSAEERVDDGAPVDAPQVVELAAGQFVDRSHPGEGRAVVLNDGTEQRFLRFEDFRTDNGPDLNVYLSAAPADADAGSLDEDFIDLGDLRGNVGPQNYEIPPDVDLSRYSTVVVWCVRFGVAFTAADLEPVV